MSSVFPHYQSFQELFCAILQTSTRTEHILSAVGNICSQKMVILSEDHVEAYLPLLSQSVDHRGWEHRMHFSIPAILCISSEFRVRIVLIYLIKGQPLQFCQFYFCSSILSSNRKNYIRFLMCLLYQQQSLLDQIIVIFCVCRQYYAQCLHVYSPQSSHSHFFHLLPPQLFRQSLLQRTSLMWAGKVTVCDRGSLGASASHLLFED